MEFWFVVRVLSSRPAGCFFHLVFFQEFKVSRTNRNIRSVLLHTSADFQQGADSHISVIWYSQPKTNGAIRILLYVSDFCHPKSKSKMTFEHLVCPEAPKSGQDTGMSICFLRV